MKAMEKIFATMRFALPAALAFAAGCLAPAPETPACWTIDSVPAVPSAGAASAKWPSARISSLEVCPPFDGRRIAVLRADGSVAFDPCNSFAASPAALAREAAHRVLRDGAFAASAVRAKSAARAAYSIEICVERLALDCREKSRREASVALAAVLLSGGEAVSSARAEATADASGGDYAEAFSSAFSKAACGVFGRL